MARQKKNQAIQNELAPKLEVSSAKELSDYKLKDKFFDKVKSYIDAKSKQAKELEANWRKLVVGGTKIVAFQGQPLTNEQLKAFDKDAKDYFLDKASAAEKKEAKADIDEVEED